MTQLSMTFTAPVSGTSLRARHSSSMGAKAASEVLGRQCLVLLTAYRQHGGLTDAELADVTGLPRATLCARRGELMKRGLVTDVGHRRNPQTHITNTVYDLWPSTPPDRR